MRTRGRRVGDAATDGGTADVTAGSSARRPAAPAARSAVPAATTLPEMPFAAPRGRGAPARAPATGDLFAPAGPAPAAPSPPRPPDPPSLARPDVAATAPVARQLWLALTCADLPLAAVARPDDDAGAPRAVVETGQARPRIVAANAAAARLGVRPGLALAAAHALVPGLEVRERAPLQEERRLQVLARWGTGYTPFVSVEPPDTLLLEVRGSLRLFGGAEALLGRVLDDLAARGHAALHALAPTPRAALWLARAAPGTRLDSPARLAGALAALPVTAAGWDERTYEQLARLGVRTLGELRRLPRDGLARRFAPALLAELDEAFGLRPGPRRRHVSPERFQERVELTCELESLAPMEPAIDRLLERMGRFLRTRDAGVARLVLTFVHRQGRTTPVAFGRGTACGEAAEWRVLLRERLGRLELPEPVCALALRTSVALPLAGQSGALPGLGAEAVQANAWALIDRLRARLGDDAVNGVCLVPEHRPERAWRLVLPRRPAAAPRAGRAAAPAAAPPASASGWVGGTGARRRARPVPTLPAAPRPLWLLAEPERLRVHQGQPCCDGALAFEAGPERIESGWWDGRDVVRDYYVARMPSGVRLWIYRERDPSQATRWFLHGVFG
jgi:protein ImuB